MARKRSRADALRETEKFEQRVKNPFHDPLVTELIEDPRLYEQMFSEEVLVGETLAVYHPTNAVLVGPQGAGKSMILNLIRYPVLGEYLHVHERPPAPLRHIAPFLGISVNLVRAGVHAFGRRSAAIAMLGREDRDVDCACAADFLAHYLFREFLRATEFLGTENGAALASWLGVSAKEVQPRAALWRNVSRWACWFGAYRGCSTRDALLTRCERRLAEWRSFLNANVDTLPAHLWNRKATLGDALHEIGNLLSCIRGNRGRLPLFVVVDQYEVLPELNPKYGSSLQRVVNDVIKARDPVVFLKIGARTYDWGTELRVWGAESRIEVQRDYVLVDLSSVLMRNENRKGWPMPRFAADVACRRIRAESDSCVDLVNVEQMFGKWSSVRESQLYYKKNSVRLTALLSPAADSVRAQIMKACGPSGTPLEIRLAGAWAAQRARAGIPESQIGREAHSHPWNRESWRKERVAVALLQIASQSNQRKLYYGWKTIVNLSGGNISAFLLLCSEIWDFATKMGEDPLVASGLEPQVQTEGIHGASKLWCERDRNEQLGGRHRYHVVKRLGHAIFEYLRRDRAISNPGHSGFSLSETELETSPNGDKLRHFLNRAVSWAILEERVHTSKEGDAPRRKWYLHPLLSPVLDVPYVRVKEPYYASVAEVYEWIFGGGHIEFGRKRRGRSTGRPLDSKQMTMPFGEAE